MFEHDALICFQNVSLNQLEIPCFLFFDSLSRSIGHRRLQKCHRQIAARLGIRPERGSHGLHGSHGSL